jgi:hypothetical protein
MGTKILADLSLHISADSAELKKGLESVKGDLKTLNSSFDSLSDKVQDSLSSMAGPLSGFASKLMSMSAPITAIGAGFALISAPVVSFFTDSQEGINMLATSMSEFKAEVGVLKGMVIELGKTMVEHMGGNEKVNTFWSNLGSKTADFVNIITGNLIPNLFKITGATAGLEKLKTTMDEAGDAAKKYTEQTQQETLEEIKLIVPRAKANELLVEARVKYSEASDSIQDRIDLLKNAQDLEGSTSKQEIKLAQDAADNYRTYNQSRLDTHQILSLTIEDTKKQAELDAKVIDLETESEQRTIKNKKEIVTLNEKSIAQIKEQFGVKSSDSVIGGITSSNSKLALGSKSLNDIGTKSIEDMAKRTKESTKATIEDLKKLPKAFDSVKESTDLAKQSNENFNKTLLEGADNFKDYVKNIKSSIKEMIGAFISEAVAKYATTVLSESAVTGPFAIGLAAAAAGAAKTLFNTIIPSFASGTSFAPGGLSLVGEMGPELVNLPRGAQVYTNNQSSNMMGGGELTCRVSGSDLLFVLNRKTKILSA